MDSEYHPMNQVAIRSRCRGWVGVLAFVPFFVCLLRAEPPTGILMNGAKFRPAVTFGETFSQRLQVTSYPDGDGGLIVDKEVLDNPVVLTAAIKADLANFDFSTLSENSTVSLQLGGFEFSATLGEATLFQGVAGRARYDFLLEEERETPDGSIQILVRRVGSIGLRWSSRTEILQVTVQFSNLEAAGFSTVLVGDYSQAAETPGSPARFTNVPIDLNLTFGDATGTRTLFAAGSANLTLRKFGSPAGENYEEYEVRKCQFRGAADITAPKLTASVPKTVNVPVLTFSGTVTDPSQIGDGLPPVSLDLAVNGIPANADPIQLETPDSKGTAVFTAANVILDSNRSKGINEIRVEAADSSGNTSFARFRTSVAPPAAGSTRSLLIFPSSASTPFSVAAISRKSGSVAAFLTNDEDRFGVRFIGTVKEVAISAKSGTFILRSDDEGVPYEIETPSGEVFSLDSDSPTLDPIFDAVGTAGVRKIRSSAGDSLRDRFRFLRPGDFYNKDDLLAINLPEMADYLDTWFDMANEIIENVIEIGSTRNPLLGGLNELRELRDTVAEHMDSIGEAVEFSNKLLDGVSDINFASADWFDGLANSLSGKVGDFASQVARLETSRNSGFWSAKVWWARDPAIDDSIWAQVVPIAQQQIDAILGGDANVTITFTNAGFVCEWNRIPTNDFASVKTSMESLYGSTPWALSGPFLFR